MKMLNELKEKPDIFTILIIIGIAILLVFNLIGKPHIPSGDQEQTPLMMCAVNLKLSYIALQMYAENNPGSYPTPEKWCDLLTPYVGEPADKIFRCPEGEKYFFYYAINPNCKPDSPPDTVLLFETNNSNINLSGGPELATTENHKEKVCNVLFNDGSVERIKKGEIGKLKWIIEEKEND